MSSCSGDHDRTQCQREQTDQVDEAEADICPFTSVEKAKHSRDDQGDKCERKEPHREQFRVDQTSGAALGEGDHDAQQAE